MRLDAFLDQREDVGAEGLRLARQPFARHDLEDALRPAEAVHDALAHLILQREEENLRLDQPEIEHRLAFPAALLGHVARHLRVVVARELARVHQLDAERLAGEVRLREYGHAFLEQEALLHALATQLERAFEARAVQVEQQARKGSLLQTPLLRNRHHPFGFG